MHLLNLYCVFQELLFSKGMQKSLIFQKHHQVVGYKGFCHEILVISKSSNFCRMK